MGSAIMLNPYFFYSQSLHESYLYSNGDNRFSIQVFGTYVSAAELQDNYRSNIPFLRDASVELYGGYGYGAELTYDPKIGDIGIIFYLSSEYLKASDEDLAIRFENDTNFAQRRFTQEYELYPIEAGLKWYLPVSSDRFKIIIGGGGGVYFGNSSRSLGVVKSTSITNTPGFSMNVLAGLEYYIARNLSANFEFKFREASFDSESRYDSNVIVISGVEYSLENPFYSRFLVDGARLSLGLKYHF